MEIVLLCILSGVIGSILEYTHINKGRIMINRPRYQYFNFAYFYVSNRRKKVSDLKKGNIDELKKLVMDLEYDFKSTSYQHVQSNRLGELLDNVHTHQYSLSEDELKPIIKQLDSYMGLKRHDALDILEIEAILKEKNSKNAAKTNYLSFENPWIKTALIILSCIFLLMYIQHIECIGLLVTNKFY